MERIAKAAILKDGVIFTPFKENGRHNDIFNALHRAGFPAPHDGVQGFTTDTGRFVNREEAVRIAGMARQFLAGREDVAIRDGRLFSEDVW
jgi:hypothetical protein